MKVTVDANGDEWQSMPGPDELAHYRKERRRPRKPKKTDYYTHEWIGHVVYLGELLQAAKDMDLDLDFVLGIRQQLDKMFYRFLMILTPQQVMTLYADPRWLEVIAMREKNGDRADQHLAQHRKVANDH